MILLAIDPGRSSGWALSEPRLSGQLDHERSAVADWLVDATQPTKAAWKRLPHHERLKRCLAAGSFWLQNIYATFAPELVVIEAQDAWGSIRAMESMLSWRACYLTMLGRLDANMIEVPVKTWQAGGRKTWANGDPLADKKSAEAILAWALEQPQLGGVIA